MHSRVNQASPQTLHTLSTPPKLHNLDTRRATLADVDVLAPLLDAYRQFYAQAPNLALARHFLQSNLQTHASVVLVAQDELGAIHGFSQLYPSFCTVEAAPIYVLYDLFVAPASRNRGAAKALLQAAHAHSVSEGMVRMDLTTARTNLQAQTLYASLGWELDTVFLGYSKRCAGTLESAQ